MKPPNTEVVVAPPLADSFNYTLVSKVKLVGTHQIRRGSSADGDEQPSGFSASDYTSTSTLLFSSLLDVCSLRGGDV